MSAIICGYIWAYTYLFVAFVLSVFCKNILKTRTEDARKVVHIMAGFGWIILEQFFEGTVHTVIITGTFVVITFFSSYVKSDYFSFMEIGEGNHGTAYFTISMFLMAIVSFVVPTLFFPFGIGIICLSCGDGMAAIVGTKFGKKSKKIIGNKSIIGFVTCIVSSIVSIIFLCFYKGTQLSIVEILCIGLVAGILELISGKYDNFAIPFGVMALSYIFLL